MEEMEIEPQQGVALENNAGPGTQDNLQGIEPNTISEAEGKDMDHTTDVNTKKRKHQRTGQISLKKRRRLHRERLSRVPNIDYVRVLNEEIEAAATSDPITRLSIEKAREWRVQDGVQQGLINWTADEREELLKSLHRPKWRQSDSITNSDIPKSAMEILDYRDRLKLQASVWHSEKKPPPPAAREITDAQVEELDNEADNIAYLQWKHEIEIEEERFGYYAILVHDLCQDLDYALRVIDGPDDPNEILTEAIKEQLPNEKLTQALSLLDLKQWLNLSEQIFMHPLTNDDSARESSISSKFERPGIFATAFCDFYNLTISITKRLVGAAMFQAQSRIRSFKYQPEKYAEVSRTDVIAALDMLDLEHNSMGYWRQAPSRLGLKIYSRSREGRRPQKALALDGNLIVTNYPRFKEEYLLTYEQVDKVLRIPFKYKIKNVKGVAHEGDEETEDVEEHEEISDEEEMEMSDVSTETPSEEQDDDDILDQLDKKEDEAEQKHLELVLHPSGRYGQAFRYGKPTLKHNPNDINQDTQLAPNYNDDWRTEVNFRSEWERYGYTLPNDAFHGAKQREKQSGKLYKPHYTKHWKPKPNVSGGENLPKENENRGSADSTSSGTEDEEDDEAMEGDGDDVESDEEEDENEDDDDDDDNDDSEEEDEDEDEQSDTDTTSSSDSDVSSSGSNDAPRDDAMKSSRDSGAESIKESSDEGTSTQGASTTPGPSQRPQSETTPGETSEPSDSTETSSESEDD